MICIKTDVKDKQKRRDDQWNKGEEDESRQKLHETSLIFFHYLPSYDKRPRATSVYFEMTI